MKQFHNELRQIELGPDLSNIPNFGIWHLNIKRAAELIVLDMWFSGEFPDIKEPEDWDGNEDDPRLKLALIYHSELFERRLVAAIDSGKLRTAYELRDFDERLDLEETFIEFSALGDWLEAHNYSEGDVLKNWMDQELELLNKAYDEITYLRAIIREGKFQTDDIRVHGRFATLEKVDSMKPSEISAACKGLIIQNQELKEKLKNALSCQPPKVDRPLSTRQRRTFLTLIAALCKYAGIDPKARGAAQRIKGITETYGAPVDDGTIQKALGEIPDAVETRMK